MPLLELNNVISNVYSLIDKAESIKKRKEELEKKLAELRDDFNKKKINEEEFKRRLNSLLNGKKEQDIISSYNSDIRSILKKIQNFNKNTLDLFEIKAIVKEKEEYETEDIKKFVKTLKRKKDIKIENKYLLYKKNLYGQIANTIFKEFSLKLTKKYPEIFKELYENLRISNMRIFSDTYINISLLSSLIFFVLAYGFSVVYFGIDNLFSIIKYFLIALLAGVLMLVGFYYWPRIVIDGKRREIRNDLPFAIIHLAAVAGSGASVTSAFNMLLRSGEYKSLNGELKRIMNYINLFGYNLTTALRAVAETTPSKELKELLNGMRSTVESGGSIKVYLKNKAEDTFNNYKNERKKYVETLSAYSDIYTALLIAAPLLFIVVLVLVGLIGNKLGGMDIQFIEKLGIYFVVPFCNIAFMVFINIMQPEM